MNCPRYTYKNITDGLNYKTDIERLVELAKETSPQGGPEEMGVPIHGAFPGVEMRKLPATEDNPSSGTLYGVGMGKLPATTGGDPNSGKFFDVPLATLLATDETTIRAALDSCVGELDFRGDLNPSLCIFRDLGWTKLIGVLAEYGGKVNELPPPLILGCYPEDTWQTEKDMTSSGVCFRRCSRA